MRNLQQDMTTGKVTGGDGKAWCEGSTAKCYVSFFPLTKGDYSVVSTDYTGYTVIKTCQGFLGIGHREFLWILSRTETISAGSLSAAQAAIAANVPHYDTAANFRYTQQGGSCTYLP